MQKALYLALFVILAVTCPAQSINLAKFQTASADSNGGGTIPSEAVDGIVSNDSRWYADGTVSGAHWLQIDLAESFTLGSAHVYLGLDDGYTIPNFTLQYANGSGWQTITTILGNTATDLNIIFPAPVLANKFRLHTTENAARIKEIALFAPNGGSGYPLGTDVTLNLANRRGPTGSTTHLTNYPWNAVDGYVDDNSRWLCENTAGPHSLQLDLASTANVGSIHLYSGVGGGSPLANFSIDYASGSGWTPIPGGTVTSGSITGNSITGNTSSAQAVNFSSPVTANKIRITFTQNYGRIRELVVMPANTTSGAPGYPLGAGVKIAPRPETTFSDYDDSWFRLARRGNDSSLVPGDTGSTHATSATPDPDRFLQFLYSPALDAYRIRQQASGKCIQVQGASKAAGALIVLGEYSAAPHQLWKLVPTDNGYFQVQNVWSGMVIASDGATPVDTANMSQQPLSLVTNPPDTQEWQPKKQDDYFKKGTGGWVGSFGAAWSYDWARGDKDSLSSDKFYVPMQHRQGWPNLSTLHERQTDWNNDAKPAYLLGFNEPDRPDQANMSVSNAIDLWPRLMAMDVPLVSPACAQGGESWWLGDFMDQHDEKGYRCDYTGGHWYSGPSADNLMNYIDTLQNRGNDRPVWLTEFSVVDWSGGSGNWSEESNYNFILEVMWRAESKDNLRKYAIFIFRGGSPASPWTLSNPRSNFLDSSGNLTPFGKAYAAWDGDMTVKSGQPYLLHNRLARHRMRNSGSSAPTPSWIRREDDSVQWLVQDAGNGKIHLTSVVDGKRLRYNGSTLDFAPALTTGSEVEWIHQIEEYGWRNVIHPGTGKFLRLNRSNDASNNPVSQTFEMVTAAAAANYSSTDWWFVKPYSEASVSQPAAPEGLVATPAENQVSLSWTAATASVAGYSVYRRVAAGAPVLLEADIVTTSYNDPSAVNGTTYYYTVTATDPFGVESGPSNEADATPGTTDPNSTFGAWAALHDLPVTAVGHDEDQDGLADGLEYLFLTDPNVPNPSPLRISLNSDGDIELRFPRNSVASGISWSIRQSPDLASWNPCTHSTEIESTDGAIDQILAVPSNIPPDRGFFVIEVTSSP